ncbi:MAG: hypothetical protein RI973_1400 [Bacteroidota bacterium]|jgi:hypothetical protein
MAAKFPGQFYLFPALSLALLLILTSCKKDTASGPSSETVVNPDTARFQLLSPEQTGVKFSNNITESFQDNILINSYLYNGGGVAVLDVNNDGLPDLYFSATQEPNRLFLNKGNLQFEDITEKAGVAAPNGVKTGVTVVDINADGWQDLYVCRSGMAPTEDRANLLFVNNGDLTFTEQAKSYNLDDRSASNHANFFDYDLDGDLDVYILNHPVAFKEVNKISARQEGNEYVRISDPRDEWESDKLFRNEGNGKFTDVSSRVGISNRAWGLSVTVSDFNRDGFPDIFVGNDYIEPDILYINDKKGGFSVQTERYFRHLSNHTMGVDIADFNNDELVDLVGLDMIAEDNQRQKELMTTMLLERYNNLIRFHYGHQIMRNVLQVNTGASPDDHGSPFSDIGVLSGVSNTDWSWSPLLADLDNDGLKDLYITNGYRRDISNLDYLNYTVDSVMQRGGLSPSNFKTIDDYLKLIPSQPLRNYAFKNMDGLNFRNMSLHWGMPELSYANGSAYADLDTDGDLDLIVNQIHGDVMIYKNKTSGRSNSNWLQVKLKGDGRNPAGTGAKVRIEYAGGKRQYQELTPTRGFFSASEHLLHFGLGPVSTVDKVEVLWPGGKRVQTMENVATNQRITLDYANSKPGSWKEKEKAKPLFNKQQVKGVEFRHQEDEFIDFNRERLIPHKFSDLGPAVAVADVNGDGLEDFYIGGARDQAGALFLQRKDGSFQRGSDAVWAQDASYEDLDCVFFDTDGDKDLDLYVVSGGSTYDAGSANYQDRLYINDGKGQFSKAQAGALPEIRASGSCVAVNDMDGDGDMDLVAGGLVTPGKYPVAPQTCLLKNNGGKFAEVCAEVAPALKELGMIRDLDWEDLDGDGKAELIVAGEWLPITIFRNNAGKLSDATAEFGFSGTEGWWNCLTVADMDSDGDKDLVAGNLGYNSRLKASAAEPLKLFAKDFDGNGSIDPILAYYNGGKLYPLALRDMIIKQLPFLKKKFVRYGVYGKATLEEVFSDSELSDAQSFEAKTFASTYFENNQGKFTAKPLPAQVQLSPVNEILAGDFNKDGKPDLLLAGNSYSSDVESGRYDAGSGLLLAGDGKGNFSAILPAESGFWAVGVVRDMAPVKLANGKSLILVVNNNDFLEAYTY